MNKIWEKYKGLWVAMKDDQQTVVASGQTLKAVLDEARQKGYDNPIMEHMPLKMYESIGGATI